MKTVVKTTKRKYKRDIQLPPFVKLVYQIAPKVCSTVDFPRLIDYSKAIADYVNITYKPEPTKRKNKRSYITSVKRALHRLVESDDFISYGDLYFYPNNVYFMRHITYLEMREYNCIAEPTIFKISSNTYSISVNANCSEEFLVLLRQFLGTECIHRVIQIEDQIIVMLKEKAFLPPEAKKDDVKPVSRYCSSPSAQALEDLICELYIHTTQSIIDDTDEDPFKRNRLKEDLEKFKESLQKKTAD